MPAQGKSSKVLIPNINTAVPFQRNYWLLNYSMNYSMLWNGMVHYRSLPDTGPYPELDKFILYSLLSAYRIHSMSLPSHSSEGNCNL
jgi:hypothetical protein